MFVVTFVVVVVVENDAQVQHLHSIKHSVLQSLQRINYILMNLTL